MIAPVVLAINLVPKLEVEPEVDVRSTTFSRSSPRPCTNPAGVGIDVEAMAATVLVFLADQNSLAKTQYELRNVVDDVDDVDINFLSEWNMSIDLPPEDNEVNDDDDEPAFLKFCFRPHAGTL